MVRNLHFRLFLLALCMQVLMLVPNFVCFADSQQEDMVLACMRVEYLTQEASFALTKDISLALVNQKLSDLGYNAVWHSNRPEVLEIIEERGRVVRPLTDTEVTVTAHVNTEPETVQTYNFVVKGTNQKIVYSDNFFHPEAVGQPISDTYLSNAGWSISGDAIASDVFSVGITEEHCLKMEKKTSSEVSAGLRLDFDSKQETMNFESEMSLSLENPNANDSAKRSLFFHAYGKTENGSAKKIFEVRLLYGESEFIIMGSKLTTGSLEELGAVTGLKDTRFRFSIQIDVNEGTYNILINGTPITNEAVIFQNSDAVTPVKKLSYMIINPYRYAENMTACWYQASLAYPAPKVIIEAPILKKIENETEVLISSPEAGRIKTELTVRNIADDEKRVALITAVYTNEGHCLKDIAIDEQSVLSGKNKTLAAIVEKEEGDIFRCYVFNGTETLQPYDIPAASPIRAEASLSYDASGRARISLHWEEAFAPRSDLDGYMVLRNQREIAYVDGETTSYDDYDADFFSEKTYEIRPVTKKGLTARGFIFKSPAETEVRLLPTVVVDPETNRTYQYITFFGKNAIRDYYTTRNWATDNVRFYFTDDDCRIFEYNIHTHMIKFIDQRFSYPRYPARDLMSVGKTTNSLYYVDASMDVVRMNLDTYVKEKIADIPDYVWRCSFMSVTDDEQNLVLTWNERGAEAVTGRIPVLNVEDGTWNTTFAHDFSVTEPQTATGMPIINPVYNNLVLFMKMQSAKERLWLLDKTDDSYRNLYAERLLTDEEPGEVMNHENWTMDGKEVVITKYATPNSIAPRGVTAIDLQGGIRYINEEIGPTHVTTSPASTRWIAADTNNSTGFTNITLIDGVTGEDYKLAHVKWTGPHPGHPHPSFSYDGNYVWFGFDSDDEEKVIQIGWMDISDLTDNPAVGGRFDLPSQNCDVLSYQNSRNYIVRDTVEGRSCFTVPEGNIMLVNVKDEYAFGGKTPTGGINFDATIQINYLDRGDGKFRYSWYYWKNDSDYIDKTKLGQKTITLTNSNQWKTETITVSGLNLENLELLKNDLRISAISGDICISDVDVTISQ